MSRNNIREYLDAVRDRYLASSNEQKRIILDEVCAITRWHRKSVIRALQRARREPIAREGRPQRYGDPLVQSVLVTIWRAANGICGKRLHAIMPMWVRHYEKHYGVLPTAIRSQLCSISAATIDRHLATVRRIAGRHGISGTKPGSLLKTQIPIQTAQWDEHRVGYLEADTVAHGGNSMAGTFVWTLDCVDIASGWTVQRAVWGKGELRVFEAIKDVERSLPFALLGFDSDNGSEFINHTIKHYLLARRHPVRYTRSREYKSNDNAHIEGKNWTHVRQQLGYNRFDNPAIVELLNKLYANEWNIYFNFYLPSVKLIEKQRVASRILRRHDDPQAPAQRLLLSPEVKQHNKRWIKHIYHTTNSFELKEEIDAQRNAILKLASQYFLEPKKL